MISKKQVSDINLHELLYVSQGSYDQTIFAQFAAVEFTNWKDTACSLKEKFKRFDNEPSEESTGCFTAVEKTVETLLIDLTI